MTEKQHEHRWFVQDEDEPVNAYLVCIQCGEVVDPKTFLAMREVMQAVAAYGYDTGGECAFCGKGILHAPDCPVSKARAILAQP